MKRHRKTISVISGFHITLGYFAAYIMLPYRYGERFHNANKFVHIRDFPNNWEVPFFIPAGYCEFMIIQADPKPFLPNPSFQRIPQVLLLQSGQAQCSFPTDAFNGVRSSTGQ
jgi:hypothetical protein